MAKEDKTYINEICRDCMRWEMFKDSCWVHWEGKKECSQKARNPDEIREKSFNFG